MLSHLTLPPLPHHRVGRLAPALPLIFISIFAYNLFKVWASVLLVRKITLMTPDPFSPSIHSARKLPSALTTSSTPHHSTLSPAAMLSFFRWHRPSDAPDVVYPSSLSTLYQGHALWYPELHETGELQIGDVGYMSEGAFIRLFNLNSSTSERQVTFWDPPFKPTIPLDPGVFKPLDKRKALDPGHYLSHGVHQLTLGGGLDV